VVRQKDTLTFRATVESWLGQFLLPFFFLGLVMVTLVNLAGLHPSTGGFGLLILMVAGVYYFALPMLLNWLQFDPQGLAGQMDGKRFHFLWSEVLAAWMIQRGRHTFLCLGTSQGTAMISLRFFDSQVVWKEVRSRVAPAALEPSAFQRLPNYRAWAAIRDQIISSDSPPRQVIDHWLLQILGWGSLIFFISSAITAWTANQHILILAFIPLTLLSILMITNWGVTEFDSNGIRRRTMTGVWEIHWKELEWIEVDPFDACMVFEGSKKRVSITGPTLWIRSGREDVLTLIQAQAEYHHVSLHRSLRALVKFSRNSRIRSK